MRRPGGACSALAPRSADDVRHARRQLVGLLAGRCAAAERAIKDFLETRMYRHARDRCASWTMRPSVVRELVRALQPTRRRHAGGVERWALAETDDEPARARRIADFIAGMTDRYALAEHARLFDSTPELR